MISSPEVRVYLVACRPYRIQPLTPVRSCRRNCWYNPQHATVCCRINRARDHARAADLIIDRDVVKSRIQNSPRVAGSVPKYNWAWPAVATVMREEGFAALYKGFLPKVLRLGPGGEFVFALRSKP